MSNIKKAISEEMNKPIKCNKRLFVFVILLIVCFFIAIAKLIEYQIIDYEKYKNSYMLNFNSQFKEVIPAARGDIIDRQGVPLATNELNLSLIISENFPHKLNEDNKAEVEKKNNQGNDIILKLIKILDKEKIKWNENSPIKRSYPYGFLEDKEVELKKLKNALSQQQYATIKDVTKLIIEKFNINEEKYSKQEIMDIVIFRAEMLINGYSDFGWKNFVVVEKVDADFLGKITGMGNELKGVQILETSKRTYPSGEYCSHFLGNIGPIYKENLEKYENKGYLQDALVGKFGIEEKYEENLRSKNGTNILKRDEDGNIIEKHPEKKPQPGNTIRLTIDFKFQKAIQDALPAYVNSHSSTYAHSKGACVCVLDVKRGEILALVNYPSYDINFYNSKYEEYKKAAMSPLKNRSLIEIFRPGSSFKPFIALTGLMTKAISPSTTFVCRDGIMPHMGCVHQRHSVGSVIDIYSAIEKSCNNYFYQAGNRIGIDKIDEYAPYFGFGVETGVEIRNSIGRVTNPSKEFEKKYNTTYRIGDLWQTSIGQAETYTTIIQQAICQMTIANKGKRLAAHLIKSIEDQNNNIIEKPKPKIMSEIKIPDYAYKTVLKGMSMMAESRPALKGLNIAAKSGSPQYSYNKNLTNAAGVGFYPTNKPEIAMAIFIEDGRTAEDFFAQIVKIYEMRKNGEL